MTSKTTSVTILLISYLPTYDGGSLIGPSSLLRPCLGLLLTRNILSDPFSSRISSTFPSLVSLHSHGPFVTTSTSPKFYLTHRVSHYPSTTLRGRLDGCSFALIDLPHVFLVFRPKPLKSVHAFDFYNVVYICREVLQPDTTPPLSFLLSPSHVLCSQKSSSLHSKLPFLGQLSLSNCYFFSPTYSLSSFEVPPSHPSVYFVLNL